MFSAENLIYPVYRKTLSLDSYGNVKADSTGTIAEGQKGPYATGYSDNSGMVMNLEWLTKDYYPEGITEPWTGGILNWEESSLVTNGSTVNLIMNFEKDFSPCTTIILNENYRSTPSILTKHAIVC